ncbi:MAG: DUF4159 domain-containing protein [Acidobacteria bacterium]|nr:DUF4159 domain-containing protein [Acidobacteriota bacterium]
MTSRRRVPWVAALCLVLAAADVLAQRGGVRPSAVGVNQPYNGRFTFTRIRYGGALGGFGRGWSSAWNHDYPQADTHLPLILDALTSLAPNLHTSNVFDLEDPEIFRNPILYLWEPGFWRITDAGAEQLRSYLLKGGFIVFDDFEAEQWTNFEQQFLRVLPDAQFIPLDHSHPIFHAFFELPAVTLPHPTVNVRPEYYGVFEDNDPSKRMLALVNYNNDIAEYWEWSGSGMFPVDTTNDAYKLGVNYFVYAMLH